MFLCLYPQEDHWGLNRSGFLVYPLWLLINNTHHSDTGHSVCFSLLDPQISIICREIEIGETSY